MGNEVMNVAEAAEFLRVGKNKVYDLVGSNEIPHRKVGGRIRFWRSALVQWLAGSQAAATE